ncbi:MAG: hypothetical protein ACE37J_14370 [Pikeienuella sp.]|uniref:hypothetical protein n=1 Tax=Pikeienuella sp. TaxID=2831957 RepID=UPI00391C6F5B
MNRIDLAGLDMAALYALARDPASPRPRREAARDALRGIRADTLSRARAALEPQPEPEAPQPATASRAPAVSRATRLEEIGAEYEAMFDAAEPLAERAHEIAAFRARLRRGADAYRAAEAETGVPWIFTGLTHGLEAGFDFSRHLHNGDPLTARTVRVPAGRPAAGQPPFSWEASAADALRGHGLHRIRDWTLARLLFELERYNGFGYRRRAAPTPYLWSFSNQYRAGKYVKDGVYDPEAVSRQAGAATVLKAMIRAGEIVAPPRAFRSA